MRSLHVPIRLRLDGGEAGAVGGLELRARGCDRGRPRRRSRARRRELPLPPGGARRPGRRRLRPGVSSAPGRGGSSASGTAATRPATVVPPSSCCRALAAEPEAVVPVLAAAATAGTLPSLVARVGAGGHRSRSPRAALTAAGAVDRPLSTRRPETRAVSGASGQPGAVSADRRGRVTVRAQVESVVARSAIVERAAHALPAGLTRAASVAVALAALGLLEAYPDIAPTLTRDAGRRARRRDRKPARRTAAAAAHRRCRAASRGDPDGPAGRQPAEPAGEARPARRWDDASAASSSCSACSTTSACLKTVTHAAPLARRPLRWTLHRLALTLVPADARDPAALAFAGLPPDAEPPADGRRAAGRRRARRPRERRAADRARSARAPRAGRSADRRARRRRLPPPRRRSSPTRAGSRSGSRSTRSPRTFAAPASISTPAGCPGSGPS